MLASSCFVDVTPNIPVTNGRSVNRQKTDGIHTPLEANILLMKKQHEGFLVLVGLDTIFSSRALEGEILEHLNDTSITLLIVATHTHTSPVLCPKLEQTMRVEAAWISETATAIADGIRQCLADRYAEVVLHRGRSTAPGSVYRRARALTLNFKGRPFVSKTYAMAANRSAPIDRSLDLFLAKNSDGTVAFAIWSWACHATATPRPSTINADFPGDVRKMLRAKIGLDVPIVYLPGFCGDIRPDISTYVSFNKARLITPFARLFARNSEAKYDALVQGIGNAALSALASAKPVTRTRPVEVSRVEVPLSEMFDGDCPESFGASRVRADDLDLLLVEAEVCCGYAPLLLPIADERTIFCGLTGEVYGYLPTDRQVEEGGYEVERFIKGFPLSGSYRHRIQDVFLNAVRSLF